MKLNKTIFLFLSTLIYADTFVNYQPVTQIQQIQQINVISVESNTQNNYNSDYILARVVKIRANDTLAVRSGPSVRYLRVGDIPPYATDVKVYRCNSRNWCKVSYRGITGWAYGKYLMSKNSSFGYRYARVVKIRANDTLAVRSGPSVRYLRVGDIPPYATNVKVYRCNSRNWCKVSYRGITGWAYGKYLRF